MNFYNYKKKLNYLLKTIFFKKKYKIKLYKNYFLKILKFSENNFNIIKIEYIFYFFKKLDFRDFERIIIIIKKFKIKIFDEIPFEFLNLILENDFKNLGKFRNILCNKNTENLYLYITRYLKRIYKKLLENKSLISKIFKSNNNISYKKLISEIQNLKSNMNIDVGFNLKKENKIYLNISMKKFIKKHKIIYSDNDFKLKREFALLNFISKNKVKLSLRNRNNKYKIIKNYLKNKFFKFKIKLKIIDYLYKRINKKYKDLNNNKLSLYDFISNFISKRLTFDKFNYLFIKHGSNLIWINDFLKISVKKNKKLLNFFYKNIIKFKNLVRNIEKSYSLKIKDLYKLFNTIELKFLKLNLIRNNIVKSKIKKLKNLIFNNNLKLSKFDLIQEIYLNLINSINNYNNNLKSKFDSFITYNAKKQLFKYRYESCSLIKIPYHVDFTIKKIINFIKYYNNIHNIGPTIKNISESLKIKYEKVIEALNLNKVPVSIDKPLMESDIDFNDVLTNDDSNFDDKIFDEELNEYMIKLIDNLNHRSSNIIKMRYGVNLSRKYTLAEVGNIYNLSRERIRQIQKFILQKFKTMLSPQKLLNFFNFEYNYYK